LHVWPWTFRSRLPLILELSDRRSHFWSWHRYYAVNGSNLMRECTACAQCSLYLSTLNFQRRVCDNSFDV
jgi:hypothetical protein